jgi:hypothetical protein
MRELVGGSAGLYGDGRRAALPRSLPHFFYFSADQFNAAAFWLHKF